MTAAVMAKVMASVMAIVGTALRASMKAPATRKLRAPRLAALRLAAALLAASGQALAADAAEKARPDFDLQLGGRLHLQHDTFDGVYSEDGDRRRASYLRRARLEASGRLPRRLAWELDLDLVPGEGLRVKTAALQWRKPQEGSLRLGRFDPDFGLEQASSSNWTTAIERSAIWDLSGDVADIGKGHGAQFARHGERVWASVGLHDKPAARGLVARAAFATAAGPVRVVHLGLSLAAERLDEENGRLRTRLGVRGVSEHEGGRRSSLAAALPGGAHYRRQLVGALEFAAALGPFSLQAEHLQRRLRGGAPARVARGEYLQLAWTVSGEPRPYDIDGAKFGRIAPSAAWGAVEIFLRLDRLRVHGESGLAARRARVQVLGVNAYFGKTWRASLDLLRVHGLARDGRRAAGDAISLRLQARF